MSKTGKKLAAIMVMVMLLASIPVSVSAGAADQMAHDIEGHTVGISQEQHIENQMRSLEIYEQIRSYLRYSTDETDFFGGAYMDVNGNLVILFTVGFDRSDTAAAAFMDAFSIEGVSFGYVEFPVAYLEELNRKIGDMLPGYANTDCIYTANVNSVGINDMKNRVIVGIVVLNDEKIAGFRENVIDSPALYFVQEERWIL